MPCEIITRVADATFAHKKVIDSGGEFAIVSLRLEPLAGGSGIQFVNGVTDGILPVELIEGAREGVEEASKKGVLAELPVTDLRVTLVDGKFHDIDSNRRTFSLAARDAFWDAMRNADPQIREN